ncbi:MarR family winged helix-turn-helix transcriptional regulator [Bordetella sp. BOR01]|uniref:MarR family winged helix-turn-helix transcriptional regulator n=1 Tax=Bordetella sp. BOR01 TaxID=2854779 RepID=UPI001C46529B|nr:MarR family winged helix-turn-helix transcriptional regulator [Bordetella sp. BOR01]MBV7481484.1 MarR family winged helix-turn-helix transcriptional regulator [Bordetella sp. BOR01]
MDTDTDRLANLLAAASLAVHGKVSDAVGRAVGGGASVPAALVTLASEPGVGITELGMRIGMSQPAAARLVASMVSQGLVERRSGPDGRSQSLVPTRRGIERASTALAMRNDLVRRLLVPLDEDEQAMLTRALEKILFQVTGSDTRPFFHCRLCDRQACIACGQKCPVSAAARLQESAGAGPAPSS